MKIDGSRDGRITSLARDQLEKLSIASAMLLYFLFDFRHFQKSKADTQVRPYNYPGDSALARVTIGSGRLPRPNQRRIESTRMITAATIIVAVRKVLM